MSLKGKARENKVIGKASSLRYIHGYSAYELAVINGFEGTEEEWQATLKGEKGDKGDKGDKGADGYTPVKGIDYDDGINGRDGEDGESVTVVDVIESTEDGGENVVLFSDGKSVRIKNGSKGSDGYTPVRGTDYWTEADKAEIKSYVDEAILGGEW